MANKFDCNGAMWILDTVDVIYTQPVWIKKILFVPNAAADGATFRSYDLTATAKATMSDKTVTTTNGITITSTGNFETAEVAANDIIYITHTASGNNKGVFVVTTRTSDNAINVGGTKASATPLTNEASIVYSWKTITPYISIPIITPTTDKCEVEIDFGDSGQRFPNLILTDLSTSAIAYVYLK